MKTINLLNKKMNDFYKAWEHENTNEQFISLNAELGTTEELKISIEKYESMISEVEKIINDISNFETIIENWDAIDLKMLDVLVSTFEIEINEFKTWLHNSEARKEILDFIGGI